MPLRDHFRPPVSKKTSWEGFHAMWPASVVRDLRTLLPEGVVAELRVRLGTMMGFEMGAREETRRPNGSVNTQSGDGIYCQWTRDEPAVAVETEPPGEYEYEVLVFDLDRERTLVAAIEFVSPGNKDRPESRDSFVAKCASLLRKGVAVTVVDLVTNMHFNLYAQLMEFIGHPDRTMNSGNPPIYAATCRWTTLGTRARLEGWSHALVVGELLPTLPLWLSEDLALPLDLEKSCEEACRDLRIP